LREIRKSDLRFRGVKTNSSELYEFSEHDENLSLAQMQLFSFQLRLRLVSKYSILIGLSHDEFYFRWLETSVIELRKATSIIDVQPSKLEPVLDQYPILQTNLSFSISKEKQDRINYDHVIKDIIGGHHIESVRERIRKSSALGHSDQKKIEINSDIYNFREIKNAKIQLRKYCFDEHQSMVDAEARRDNVSDERWRRDFGAPILSGWFS